MTTENLLIVQGGGATPVFNVSLAAVVERAAEESRIGRVFGARFGMAGLCAGDFLELGNLAADELHGIANSPGAALGTSRFAPTGEDLDGAIQQLRQMRIRYVVFNGGNGTMRGADIFRQHCRSTGYDVQIVGVPKTIDNDIAHTDRCPGFGSAARYVAQSTLDLAMDIRSLPQPVSIFETLGRDVGWLAASSTAAKLLPDDAPHLVLVPEVPFSEETFLGALDGVVRRLGWAVVVVSEGISYADGTPVFQQVVKGRNGSSNRPLIGGVAQYLSGLVNERLGIRGRSEKPGLIGRSCMAYRSPQDVKDAELVGRAAVRALLAGETGQMIALEPIAASRPDSTRLIPLSEAGGSQRRIPTEWLSGEMLGVTDQFRDYIKPLIGELSYYRNSLSRRSVRV